VEYSFGSALKAGDLAPELRGRLLSVERSPVELHNESRERVVLFPRHLPPVLRSLPPHPLKPLLGLGDRDPCTVVVEVDAVMALAAESDERPIILTVEHELIVRNVMHVRSLAAADASPLCSAHHPLADQLPLIGVQIRCIRLGRHVAPFGSTTWVVGSEAASPPRDTPGTVVLVSPLSSVGCSCWVAALVRLTCPTPSVPAAYPPTGRGPKSPAEPTKVSRAASLSTGRPPRCEHVGNPAWVCHTPGNATWYSVLVAFDTSDPTTASAAAASLRATRSGRSSRSGRSILAIASSGDLLRHLTDWHGHARMGPC